VLLFLTRPESLIFLGGIALGILIARRRQVAQVSLLPLVVWLVGILLVTLWRFTVFGDFIPNSVRAKSVLEFSPALAALLWPRIMAGSRYIAAAIGASAGLVLLGTAGLVTLRKTFAGFVALVILAGGLLVILVNSGDWMPNYRLFMPFLPLLALLSGLALQQIRLRLPRRWPRALDAVSLALAILLTVNAFWHSRDRQFFVARLWRDGVCYRLAGEALRPHLPPQALIAPEAIGLLGYTLVDFPVLDFFGLTEPFIARDGVIPIETFTMGKHHYSYTMQQHPALFFFHSDLTNHVPMLNRWGYSEQYHTYLLSDPRQSCELYIGIRAGLVDRLLPPLQQTFTVQPMDTAGLGRNPHGTWPLGEK
jgi:hypothetical protein